MAIDTMRLDAADAGGVETAARLLGEGRLVAFPTETVYGLGADATDAAAVARLYAAKGRPRFNPLIAHLPDAAAAMRHGVFDATAARLAAAFWPGPLTLVVPVRPACVIASLARAGLDSIALRVPAHPVAHALLRAVGRPIVAPSANASGRISPTRAAHVLASLAGRIDAVLDGGPTSVGLESTIIACLGGPPRMLRPGGLARATIESVLGIVLRDADPEQSGDTPRRAPGQLVSHYAPRAAVRLDATSLATDEAGLDFAGQLAAGAMPGARLRDLSPHGDLVEAAACLFDLLHDLDALRPQTIAVAPIPSHGLGEAIRDRLSRAAAPRG